MEMGPIAILIMRKNLYFIPTFRIQSPSPSQSLTPREAPGSDVCPSVDAEDLHCENLAALCKMLSFKTHAKTML